MVNGYARIERLSFDAFNEAADFFTGPALGRPPKDSQQTKAAKRQAYQDICDRNAAEGEFGVGKRSYGLNRIMAHLPETSFCVIGIALLCMNLAKRLRSLLRGLLRVLRYYPNDFMLMVSA